MIINIFIFALGAIFGSFCNCFISRKIKNQSIIYPPSHCDFCNHRLKIWEKIPIISFLILKGRCNYCKKKIPIDNFLMELTCGILGILFFDVNNLLKSILLIFALYLSLVIAIIDLKSFDIYLNQIGILALIGFVYRLLYLKFDAEFILISIAFSVIYFVIYKIFKKSLGDGDIYFYLALFLFIENIEIIYFILYSIWLGAIFGIIIGIKNKNMKIKIPFCIYIFLAFLIVMVKLRILSWKRRVLL